MGARSACGFCSDLALCSVRAEREESERECVRAWCVYVCLSVPGCGGLAASGSFSLFPPRFGKACLCPLLFQVSDVALPFRNSTSGFLPISVSPLSAHPPVCAVRGVRSPLPGASPLVSGDGTKESWYLALTSAVSGAAQETFCPQIAPLPPGLNQQAPS